MRYYAKYSNGILVCVGVGLGGDEITEEQYRAFREEIHEKSRYTDLLCSGEISIDDVPAQWKAELEQKMSEHNASEVSAEEALAELLAALE